jgi:hypothetical protein
VLSIALAISCNQAGSNGHFATAHEHKVRFLSSEETTPRQAKKTDTKLARKYLRLPDPLLMKATIGSVPAETTVPEVPSHASASPTEYPARESLQYCRAAAEKLL